MPESDGSPVTIRELFPPGDIIGEWVYSVSVLCDDLGVIFSQLKPALASQQLRETLFFARQLFTRLYEARRLVVAVDGHPELRNLMLGPDSANPFGKLLLEVYSARDGEDASLVEQTYGRFRHQTVHLMWPGSAELETALSRAGFLPARIWMSGAGPVNQWVQGVSGMLLFGEVQEDDWMERFQKMNDLAGRIAGAWIMLLGIVLIVYAKGKGVDLERLVTVEE